MLRSKASRWAAAPYLVWMVLFIVVPLGIVVWYALTNSDGQVTLANLTSIGRYASVFGRSLLLAAEATIICLVLAYPVGYFLSRLRANKQHIMLMLVMLPMWMNFLLRTYAWMTLLEKNGLVWMVLFIVVPLGIVVWYALTNSDGQVTLANLTSIGRYASVFGRSLLLAAEATIICLVLAYPVGYFLSRLRANKQHIMLMLVMLPMWMNFLLRTYAWMTLLEKNGLINKLLGLFGIGPFNMINTSGAVVLGMVYNYLPYMILPLYTAMTKIDNSVVEAAQDLGANVFQILGRVLIPLSKPGIATGITMVFVPAVSTFIISRMLGGGANLLIGDLIELQFLGNSYNLNLGSAMSLVLMVIVLLCMSFTSSFDEEEMEGVM